MATTSSPNSLTPTSTPTNNSNGNGGDFTDFFSASKSPPLIVAFLAIGVFIVALSGIFGWRRLSQPHGLMGPPPGAMTNRRHKSILPGTKPVFSDLWVDLRGPEPSAGRSSINATGFYRWEHTLPMSASLRFPVSTVEPQASVGPMSNTQSAVAPLAGHPIPSRILRCFESTIRRYHLPVRSPPPPLPSTSSPLASPPPQASQAIPLVPLASPGEGAEQLQLKSLATPPRASEHTLDEADWSDALSVLVSVIVAMPTQQRSGCWRTTGREEAPSVSEGMSLELGEYCIGTMDVPWGEAG